MTTLLTAAEVILYAFSPLDQITEDGIKESKIVSAQVKFLRPALGDALIDKIADEEYEELGDFVRPALAYYVRYEIIPDLSLRVGNIGTQMLSSMNSEGASDKQRAESRQAALETAQSLLNAAIEIIADDPTAYPEYPYTRPTGSKAKTGVILPHYKTAKQ